VGAEGLVDMVERLDVLRVVHVVDAEESLAGGDTLLGQRDGLGLLIDDVVALDLRLDLGSLPSTIVAAFLSFGMIRSIL